MVRPLFVLFWLAFVVSAFPIPRKEPLIPESDRLNVTLREWPWENWLYGPPCPPRYQQKLLSIQPSDVQLALNEVDALVELFTKQLAALNIQVGISVGIVYNQQTLFSKGFGEIQKNSNQPPSETTVFNIGSVTKIFTSLALYHSVEKQFVQLTDPVTLYFNENSPPVFSIHNPYSSEGSDAVTLHALASQASGLPREAYCGAYPVTNNCTDKNTAAKLNLEHLSEFGLLYSPFTGSHYSNLGLALLGRSLERAWDISYEDYMVDTIFPSIGMNTMTGFTYTQDVIDNMATGYIVEGPNEKGNYTTIPAVNYNTKEFGWSAPAGGAYSNRQDMLNFLKWMFGSHDSGSVLSQSYVNEYLAPGMLMANGIELFGQGTWETFYANGYWTFTKGGLTASMGTSITLVPELKLGVSVMMNINSGIDSDMLTAKINKIMVPALLKSLNQVQNPLPLPTNYSVFLGSYGYSTPLLEIGESSKNNGVLEGSVISTGSVDFIWDSAQDYGDFIAFRYSSTKNLSSCMSQASVGNRAIAYFQIKNGNPYVTINDENVSFYHIPMLKS